MKVEKPSMRTPPDATHAPSAGWPPATIIAVTMPTTATSHPLRRPAKALPRNANSAAATSTSSGASSRKVCKEVVDELMDVPISG